MEAGHQCCGRRISHHVPPYSPHTADLMVLVPGEVAKKGLCDGESDSLRERAWGAGFGEGEVPWGIKRKEREGGWRMGVVVER
jgi:hypothetical protein